MPPDAGVATIGQLTVPQLNLFAHKAVLALYFEHFRRGLSNAGRLCAFWRSKEDFAQGGIPGAFLELLPAYASIAQGRWNERQTFEYRYATNQVEGLFGCLARFRRLVVFGFAVQDAGSLPADDMDWIAPTDLLSILVSPRFRKKH